MEPDIIAELEEGKENAITSTELAERLNISETNGNPVTRGMITRQMEESGVPIGACSQGYFIISSKDEMIEYLIKLNSRIDGIQERKRIVMRAYSDS